MSRPTKPQTHSSDQLARRTFLHLTGLGVASAFLQSESTAEPLNTADFEKLIPAEKKFKQEWLDCLVARGQPETFSGDDLKYIGMPIGGIGCGTVYLGGDGNLWLWDVFNQIEEGSSQQVVEYANQKIQPRDGANYIRPLEAWRFSSPINFWLKLKDVENEFALEHKSHTKFTGQYPIGVVTYQEAELPLQIKLEAFSPFMPLNADDSGLPATIMVYTLTNTSQAVVEGHLTGAMENIIGRQSFKSPGLFERHHAITQEKGWSQATCFAKSKTAEERMNVLPDVGTMTLALVGPPAEVAVAGEEFTAGPMRKGPSLLGRAFTLAPGESTTINFIIAWHFPNLTISEKLKGRYYATKFKNAAEVTKYVVEHFERLTKTTKLWRDTWYNSTLPHWFLNRTFANVSTLATSTCTRLADGRFWAWEGGGCGPGTCTHVWHYAQAMGRLFPELERSVREKVDYGLAFDAKTGVVYSRAEFGNTFAVDGQCGTILRAYREHQMSANSEFLERNWAKIKLSLKNLISRDKDRTGLLAGPWVNTLATDVNGNEWYGTVPWIVGLYHAALRAGEEMSKEMGDKEFARECRSLFDKGLPALDKLTWRDMHGYYVQVTDPNHVHEMGSYEGCHIDQVFGQSWAFQVGLGRVMDEKHTKQALESIWKYSVAPDVGPFREVNKSGRWYALPGEGGTLMVTFPYGNRPKFEAADEKYAGMFNECWTGCEWQLASHLLWEGMVTQGMAVARLVHDRYHPRLRNPYNEIEHGDHSARAMASYGAFLAVCGFEYHGPKGHIGFAPRLSPDDFAAPFVAAEGWGTYSQTRSEGTLTATLNLKHGKLRLKSIGLELPDKAKGGMVEVKAQEKPIHATIFQTNQRIIVTFTDEIQLQIGHEAVIQVDYM